MHRNRLIAVVVLLVVVGLLGLAGAGAADALRAKPTPAAVVNLARTFEELKQRTSLEAELTSAREKLIEEGQQRQEALKQRQSKLDLLDRNGPAFAEEQNQLGLDAVEYQAWEKYQQWQLARMEREMYQQLYNTAIEAVNAVAESNGYELVMLKEGDPGFQYRISQDGKTQMSIRKVLYASETLDITDQVIQRANNQYASGQ